MLVASGLYLKKTGKVGDLKHQSKLKVDFRSKLLHGISFH